MRKMMWARITITPCTKIWSGYTSVSCKCQLVHRYISTYTPLVAMISVTVIQRADEIHRGL